MSADTSNTTGAALGHSDAASVVDSGVAPALELRGITVHYGSTLAVNNMNVTVPQGVVMGLVGPNGSGKSTLIKAALNLVDHTGQVRFFGQPLDAVRDRVAYMPQSAMVDWDYPITVEQVVSMGLYSQLGWLRRFSSSHKATVRHAMERVGIEELGKRHISALSGGQRRRVFVARILAQQPDIYLMDEPFAGVDAASEKVIHGVLRQLRDEGKTVVIVHHDLSTVRELCDHVTIVNKTLVASGPVNQAFTKENLNKAFGLGLM